MKTANIKTKYTVSVLKDIQKAIKAGKDVPLIKLNNPEEVFRKLEADPTVSKAEAENILKAVFANNKAKISRIKSQNIQKIATSKAKKALPAKKFRNSSVLQKRYSDAEIKAVRTKRDEARAEMAKWEYYASYDKRISDAYKAYMLCKRDVFCWSAKEKEAQWNALISKQESEKQKYAAAKAVYDTYATKLEDMFRDNEDYVAMQEAQQEREIQRQDELRRQEAHEAALRKAGYETESIKTDIAAQLTEIMRLEQETKLAEQEGQALQTASENKTYGTSTTVINEAPPENNKKYWIAGGALLLVAAAVSIPLILKK